MILDMIILLLGFVVILKASDVLVEAASSIALKLKIPKMLIALTIVSFGTSAPEVAISFQSLSQGNGVIGFANVIGSCVVNILLIIGLASFLKPIKVKHATIKKELPLLTLVTCDMAKHKAIQKLKIFTWLFLIYKIRTLNVSFPIL